MNIDDLMNQQASYNQDAKTVTGFFNLNEKELYEKAKTVCLKAVDDGKKSDVIMAIDALTETKLEAIVLSYIAAEKLYEMQSDSDSSVGTAPKIAMSLAICQSEGFMEEDNMEDIAEVFSKVFSSL